jgi:3-isopropylmalate dehydrogenase
VSYTVAFLARHGIGPEVTAEASRAIDAASRLHGFYVDEHHVPFGADALMRFGHPFPPPSRRAVLASDAVLVASHGDEELSVLEDELDLRASVVRVRFDLREEVSVLAPLGEDSWEWTLERGFELARSLRARISLVGVDGRWAAAAAAAEERHDGLQVERLTPRTALRELVFSPARFDVVVCPPELAAAAADVTASLSADRTSAWGRLAPSGPGVFGPAHGSADDIAGQGVADPSSMLLAAALMLGEGLGERSAAATLAAAVGRIAATGPASTRGVADTVLAQLPLTLANTEFYREIA